MSVKASSLVVGLVTFIPGLAALTGRRTGGTVSARYCYSVWLRHLSMLHGAGQSTRFGTVAELGPGDSLGIGLAALVSCAERYVAVDVVRYADTRRNLQIFEELVTLFRDRSPIPDDVEFPLVRPLLRSYAFPAEILTPTRLDLALAPKRLDSIRAAIGAPATDPRGSGRIRYLTPSQTDRIETGSVDLILSQSVLEFPPDLAGVYAEMCRWLRRGGIMSHEIDFKSIGMTREWNGHWSCPDVCWRLAAGRRRHRINREPHSRHLAILQKVGCHIVRDERSVQSAGITREQLAPRFRDLTDQDLMTSSALIQAVKIA